MILLQGYGETGDMWVALAEDLAQLVGSLFLAILIARLAGVYPPRREQTWHDVSGGG